MKTKLLTAKKHKDLINEIVAGNHGAMTKWFHKTVWEMITASMDDAELDDMRFDQMDLDWFKKRVRIIPDAFAVYLFRKKLVIFEVEIYSRLTPDKMRQICSLAVDLAIWDWTLTLIRVDEYGRFRKERPEQFMFA